MALTGPLAPNGKQALLGAKIWEEETNAKGGLLDRPVKLITYDDQSNPANVGGRRHRSSLGCSCTGARLPSKSGSFAMLLCDVGGDTPGLKRKQLGPAKSPARLAPPDRRKQGPFNFWKTTPYKVVFGCASCAPR